MYGIVEIGGHQYKVTAGEVIDVEKQDLEAGKQVDFDKVYFVGGENPVVGAPQVNGAKVTALVIKHARSRKLLVFKRKPGGWKKKIGHRQHYTALLITNIDDGNGNKSEIDKKSKNAQKYLK